MLKIKTITMKNFMSVGSVTQAIDLSENKLTLILGDNIDLGSEGSRNGVGKSVIVDALSFALYGVAARKITIGNLVNKINGKNMFVSLEFEKNGRTYKIERGRNPTVFRFFVDGNDVDKVEKDEAQSNTRDSQVDINKLIGCSSTLFKHIIALNPDTIPFLAESQPKQREIIEELLGITQLSEKAEILKEGIKETKTEVEREEFRHKMIEDNNLKTKKTIDQLTIKSNGWEEKHIEMLEKLERQINKMSEVDIEAEIQKHKDIEEQNRLAQEENDAIHAFGDERQAFNDMKREYDDAVDDAERTCDIAKAGIDITIRDITNIEEKEKTLTDNHIQLLEHRCPACGQEVHDDKHDDMIKESKERIEALMVQKNKALDDLKAWELNEIKRKATYNECVKAVGALIFVSKLPPIVHHERTKITTHYDTVHDAYEHKSNLDNLIAMFEKEAMLENPHLDQIEIMTKNNIQEIDFEMMNELVNLLNHQDFLFKLLTRKDSNIRIQIVEQNLAFLNSRLDHYTKQIGLPHQVYFNGDLSVDITKIGQSFDIGNLSSGEKTRLVLALSFAFRDIHEALNSPINLMFVDELIDSGMDSKGADNALSILKANARDHKKNIFLISHRDDFIARVSNVLMVEMKNNFTDYRYEMDVQI